MTQVRPLVEILAEITDFRKEKGKRHPLSAILALACVAMICGVKGYCAMAEWGRNYGEVLKNLVLEGRIITVDALLTQVKVSQDIIDGDGDYVR